MKFEFEHNNEIISFNVLKTKRKTMSIKIDECGTITVSVPLKVSNDYILKIVKEKASWIKNKTEEIKKHSSNKIKREAKENSTYMYLGEEYPVHIFLDVNRKDIKIELCNEDLNGLKANKILIKKESYKIDKSNIEKSINKFINKSELINSFIIHTYTLEKDYIKKALEKWYRTQTLKIVESRINHFSINFKDRVKDIKVKEQKRRWASCTGNNSILFNWRCSMARADVLDYIVVHEMCHMDYRNHSKDFWNRVSEIMPDYKEKHEWLKINGVNLSL